MSAPTEQPETTAVVLAANGPRVGLLTPLAAPEQVIAAQNAARDVVAKALQKGRDYGVIPGAGAKPTLLKPGAERLGLAFGLAPRFRIVEREIDHDRRVEWVKRNKKSGTQTGTSIGLYRYVIECEIVHRETGVVIASCLGVCSTMESKYVDRPRDVENTIAKMAEKRALVGAMLLALGLSDQFTQDVEDLAANGALGDDDGDGPGAPVDDAQTGAPEAHCPKCKGQMWDNRESKTNPKAPDYKCRDKTCDGVYWQGQWPPKKDAITRDTEFDQGKFAGTKVRDLPIEFLRWAIEDGRKLGERTPAWQDAFSAELDERAVEAREAAEPASVAKAASDAALGVTESEKPRPRVTDRTSHEPMPGEEALPF